MNYTTPGVFIREEDRFPQGVVAVSTTTPVFLGFSSKGALATPVQITSYADFVAEFGPKFTPNFSFKITSNKFTGVFAHYRYFLHDSVDLFFKNGGTNCYIIRVDDFGKSYNAGKTNAAIAAIKLAEDASTICFPDLYAKKKTGSGNSQTMSNIYGTHLPTVSSSLVNLAGELKDKICLFDADKTTNDSNADATNVRNSITPVLTENNKYGAVYYPWINKVLEEPVRLAQLDVPAPFDNNFNYLFYKQLTNCANQLVVENGNQVPTSSNLSEKYQQAISTFHSATTAASRKAAFAQLLKVGVDTLITLSKFENHLVATNSMNQPLIQAMMDAVHANIDFKTHVRNMLRFHGLLKGTPVITNAAIAVTAINNPWVNLGAGTDTATNVQSDVTLLTGLSTAITATPPVAADIPIYVAAIEEETYFSIPLILNTLTKVHQEMQRLVTNQEGLIFNPGVYGEKAFVEMKKLAEAYLKQVPTQGAIAGLYATNDNQSGAWHAPANLSVQGVEGPVKQVNNATQGRLNIDPDTGKSINVLREFTGKGTLVWGARTLAGNSNEWAYVPVRRYFNFVEKSLELAIQPYLFRSNDASTWIQVKAMVTSFLIDQYRQGALQGSSFEEAFFVKIGLGETMTQDDIRNGEMKIQLGLAVVRPAEFIVITFSHKALSSI